MKVVPCGPDACTCPAGVIYAAVFVDQSDNRAELLHSACLVHRSSLACAVGVRLARPGGHITMRQNRGGPRHGQIGTSACRVPVVSASRTLGWTFSQRPCENAIVVPDWCSARGVGWM